MNKKETSKFFSKDAKYLLALHSSTDTLGVGFIQINKTETIYKSSSYKVSRDLSNYLFNYIEELLPAKFWPKIIRLSVAIGPGGYTGTRTTVIFARTLAQQLHCEVDGISSFELMAYRYAEKNILKEDEKTFWITQELKRRGIVAGKYQAINSKNNPNNLLIRELESPHLLPVNQEVYPSFSFSEEIDDDIHRLLEISLNAYKSNKKSSWVNISPIYPTSPVNLSR